MNDIRTKFLQISSSRSGRAALMALSFVPALAVMGLIFFFSSQNAALSGNLSYPVTAGLVGVIDRIFSLGLSGAELAAASEIYHFLVRKLAHMTEYAVLAAALYFPLLLPFLCGAG